MLASRSAGFEGRRRCRLDGPFPQMRAVFPNEPLAQVFVEPSQQQQAARDADFVRSQLPSKGLFEGHDWRVALEPFPISQELHGELQTLGRVLLQFNRALNLLYRLSVSGKQPAWVSQWLDIGKPPEVVELQRHPTFKNELPRVIRPDVLLTDNGFSITELDSVPGGIGLTAWLNQTYSQLPAPSPVASGASETRNVVGGPAGMLEGFRGIFGAAPGVHIIVSEESATYRPEMEWIAGQLGEGRFKVRDSRATAFDPGDAVYRFFELYDAPNVASSQTIFELAQARQIVLTPPPKPLFEEKMVFALLWNRNLRSFWRQELGESFLNRLQKRVPYTWFVDPQPLPPHAAVPLLEITDWRQLKALSQKERDLILKVSGFAANAWGSRGVFLGSDLSSADWAAAVDQAISGADSSPFVLQQFHRPGIVETKWWDPVAGAIQTMKGRARLCPYYFVEGEAENARATLRGILATTCPADKKIIHGMRDAVLAPCAVDSPSPDR